MANIMIDIAAEFVGKPAFKQADTATGKLTNNVKSLAKTLGVAFSTTAVIAFGKASVKAFAEDEAAATRLTKAVENLGLGFEDSRIKVFIADLEKTANVADDVLRPAFQSLLNTTGSVAKSQELLRLALDVSAGSGVDAVQVSKDLSLAYLGQTKGLTKYNLGLTKAELSTAGFNKIQQKLNEQFAGQNAARLDTYTGKMAALNIAFGNAQETIGEGLLESFSILAGDQGIGKATNAMDEFSESIKFALIGMADLTSFEAPAGTVSLFGLLLAPIRDSLMAGPLGALIRLGEKASIKPKPFSTPMSISNSTDSAVKAENARKAAEAEAKKRAAELLAMQKKTLKSQQDALKLSKAKAIFDLQKIQIEAALKGKITEEERIRLKLMQAIENENISDIEKYTKALDAAQKKTKELQTDLDALKANKFSDPFAAFNAGAKTAIENAKAINAALQLGQFVPVVPGTGGVMGGSTSAGNYPSSGFPNASVPYTPAGSSGSTVNVTVNAGVGDPEAIARVIEDTLRQSSYRGTGALVAL